MADEVEKVFQTFRVKLLKFWKELTTKNKPSGPEARASAIAEGTVLGVASFPLSIGYLQTVVFRPLRITNNKRIIGSLFGGLSVTLSASLSSLVFVHYVDFSRRVNARAFEFYKMKFDSYFPSFEFNFKKSDMLLYCAGSAAVFKAFGGRFRSVLPSSLIHPGSFARVSLPANSQSYASDVARVKLNQLGRKYGCHTCGRKRWCSFVGDHIPPNKLVKPGQKQRFYPQCNKCSSFQGANLSGTVIKKKLIKTHATTLKLYHLWLPVPLAVMWLKAQYCPSDDNGD